MTQRRSSIRLYVLGGVLSVVTMLLFALPAVPLGVPGEWTWPRFRPEMMEWDVAILRFLPVAAGLAVYIAAVTWSSRFVAKASRMRMSVLLSLFVCAAFATQWILSQAAPSLYATLKPRWVLYSPDSSGYFTEARKIASTREYLAGYEQKTREGDVLHLGTHPPGLVLLYRAALLVCSGSDLLTDILTNTEPDESRRLFHELENVAAIARPLDDAEMAALRLVGLLTAVVAAAAVVPIFLALCRLQIDRQAAWLVTAFWPLVPAVIVFFPKSDVLFSGLSALALWLAIVGGTSNSGRVRVLSGAGCGLIVFVAATLSLAILPVALICGVFWLQPLSLRRGIKAWAGSVAVASVVSAAVAFAAATLVVSLATDCNLVTVWKINLTKHAGFYEQYPRTRWLWTMVNPVELAFSLGLPLAVLSLAGIGKLMFANRLTAVDQTPADASAGAGFMDRGLLAKQAAAGNIALAIIAVWALLWLSGKNMGEAARLWILLMPCAVILGGLAFRSTSKSRTAPNRLLKPETPGSRSLCGLLIFQAICSLITVAFIVGFDRLR